MASVFETFRKKFINSFELYPRDYLSTLDYSYDAILWFLISNLQLISDWKTFTESTIRGSTLMIFKGYTVFNNEFLKPGNAKEPTLSMLIIYLDTVLYNISQLKFLIVLIQKTSNSYSNDSSIGCFLEIDLDYPD